MAGFTIETLGETSSASPAPIPKMDVANIFNTPYNIKKRPFSSIEYCSKGGA